ncbi:hypothetical protein [Streptomyces mirabilis]|uniref:hypothetical protein n=1 Tax=Streptomyces mirabilis TaxID=68239 RepID=UPI0033F83F08
MIDKYKNEYKTPVEATGETVWKAVEEESRTRNVYSQAQKRYGDQPETLSIFSNNYEDARGVKAAWSKAHNYVAGFEPDVNPIRAWGDLRDGSPGAAAFMAAVEKMDAYERKWVAQTWQGSVARHARESSNFLSPHRSERTHQPQSSATSAPQQPRKPERSTSPGKR